MSNKKYVDKLDSINLNLYQKQAVIDVIKEIIKDNSIEVLKDTFVSREEFTKALDEIKSAINKNNVSMLVDKKIADDISDDAIIDKQNNFNFKIN